MSEKERKNPSTMEAEKIFFELLPEIPITLRRVCRKFGYSPDPATFEGLVQRIILLLLEQDYHRLRTFDHQASARTWLDRVVRNYIGHHLHKLARETSLEDFPQDSFTSPPDQEETVLSLERKRLLNEALGKLTPREQMLFQLLCEDGMIIANIAKMMGIKSSTAYRYKHDLIKKIQKLINVRGGGKELIKNIFTRIPRFSRQPSLYI